MDIKVGTIFKWAVVDKRNDDSELCERGQCVGIVTNVDEGNGYSISVKWYDMCAFHAEVDPSGTGPYTREYIYKIGQLD